MDDNKQPHMLSVTEVADRLAVSEATIRRWIRDGHLHAHQFAPGGAIRIDARELNPEPPKMAWMSAS